MVGRMKSMEALGFIESLETIDNLTVGEQYPDCVASIKNDLTRVIRYTANDGTQFDNEEDCILYDHRHLRCFKFFNYAGIEVPTLKNAEYIRVYKPNPKLISGLGEIYGVYTEGVSGKGIYTYDGGSGMWVKIEEQIQSYKDHVEILEGIKNALEQS